MEESESKNRPSLSSWITSLAVSVVCCATLFVIFADHLDSLKEKIDGAQARTELVERRLNDMSNQIDIIRRHSVPQQAQNISVMPPANDGSSTNPPVAIAPSVPEATEAPPVVSPPVLPVPPNTAK